MSSRLGQGLALAWPLSELDAHPFSRCVWLWGSVGRGEQLHGLGMKQGKGGKVLPQVPLGNDFSVGSAVKWFRVYGISCINCEIDIVLFFMGV